MLKIILLSKTFLILFNIGNMTNNKKRIKKQDKHHDSDFDDSSDSSDSGTSDVYMWRGVVGPVARQTNIHPTLVRLMAQSMYDNKETITIPNVIEQIQRPTLPPVKPTLPPVKPIPPPPVRQADPEPYVPPPPPPKEKEVITVVIPPEPEPEPEPEPYVPPRKIIPAPPPRKVVVIEPPKPVPLPVVDDMELDISPFKAQYEQLKYNEKHINNIMTELLRIFNDQCENCTLGVLDDVNPFDDLVKVTLSAQSEHNDGVYRQLDEAEVNFAAIFATQKIFVEMLGDTVESLVASLASL
jgi:hypothetical protein